MSFSLLKSLSERFNMSQPFEFFGCYISLWTGSYTCSNQKDRKKLKNIWGYIYDWENLCFWNVVKFHENIFACWEIDTLHHSQSEVFKVLHMMGYLLKYSCNHSSWFSTPNRGLIMWWVKIVWASSSCYIGSKLLHPSFF